MSTNRPPLDNNDDASQLDELLGVYALDAIEPAERDLLETYLASNASARDEVDGHHEVAALLATGTSKTTAEAPAGLWDKISAAIDANPIQIDEAQRAFPELVAADSSLGPAPRPEPTPAPGSSLGATPAAPSTSSASASPARRLGAPLLAAAAALLLIGGFLAGQLFTGSSDDVDSLEERAAAVFEDPDARSVALTSETDSSLVVAAAFGADDIGYLDGTELPALNPDRTYQLWAIYDDDDVVSLGVLGNDPGIKTFLADEDLSLLVVTEEVRGGVTSSENGAVVAGAI